MRPIYRPSAQPFPVMETSSVTVISAYSFAMPGCDPWSYIVGNAIGLEQSGVLRPAIVQDCQYDSANTRTVVTVSITLNATAALRVWKSVGSDKYYMLGGGDKGIWAFIPGGMAAGASVVDTSPAIHAGRFNNPAHTLLTTGSPVYSSDISILGGSPLKLGSNKALAFGTGWQGWSNKNGMLIRMHLNVPALVAGENLDLIWAYYAGQNMNQICVLPNGAITFYSQSNGMSQTYVNSTTPAGYIMAGTTVDLCFEQDFTGKIRIWIDGQYKTTLTSAYAMQYPAMPWAVGQHSGLTYDPQAGTFSHSVPGTPSYFYISEYLVLNYAPILADNVNIPPVNKFFSYPGLREAA